jgi:2-isopropylmalate synthase
MSKKSTPEAFGVRLAEPYFTGSKWVSPLNFFEEVRQRMTIPKKVIIHDVTLRDGEQTPRVAFRPEEKLFIAEEMDKIGIPSIEPGLPVIEEDKQVIKTLVQMDLSARITPLARLQKEDVEFLIDAKVDGMVLEFGINPYLIKYVYNLTPDELINRIIEYSNKAKQETGMYIEFMGWDTFRIPDLSYIKNFFSRILEKGSIDRITVSDTFGMAHPLAMQFMIQKLREWFPSIPLGLHIHNDFGLATANALMAVVSGVDEVHCSVNGLGERAGNAPTEEVAMALEYLLNIDTGINLKGLNRLSEIVAEVSKVRPATNKPIVGSRLFEVESGIVIHIMQELEEKGFKVAHMLPYDPQSVGRSPVQFIPGKGSGHHYVEGLLKELKASASQEQIREIVKQIKVTASVLKNALPRDLAESIVWEVLKG